MENVLYSKREYRFQEVFFNGHPVNKKNPNPPPPRKPKKTEQQPPPPPPPENEQPPKKNDDNANPPKQKKKRHGWLKFIVILVFLVLTAVVGGLSILISRVEYVRDNPDHAAVESAVGELKSDGNVQNIIIFGVDKHSEGENGRADTMMLISIDKKHHVIKQTSFLRDLYLPVFQKNEDKLNAAFAAGGAKLAVETIEYSFKIRIDNYVIVDFDSFTYIVDSMGGIDITLTGEEINYIDWQSHKNRQVEAEDELDAIKPEMNETGGYDVHINGRQALWHARNRGEEGICSGDDFTRTQRQREVIDAVMKKVGSLNIADFVKIAYDVAPMITTNLNLGDTLKTGFGMVRYLKYESMGYKVPQSFNFDYDKVNGQSVIRIVNLEEEQKALQDFIFNKEFNNEQ